jgi:5'-AMP-activated protein kinase, catalytic alpha subunit
MNSYNPAGEIMQGGKRSLCFNAIYELALGGDLFDFVITGALPEKMARMYFRQLIAGIEYMHSKGVYHRDLKFENILLNEALKLKIADFGLSINIK